MFGIQCDDVREALSPKDRVLQTTHPQGILVYKCDVYDMFYVFV